MNFLWDPIGWLEETGVLGVMENAVRGLSFSLSTIVYKLVINLYNLFEDLCTARILDGTLTKEIATRIGLILGLVMFFNIAFAFIKMFITPDTLTDKEKGAVSIVKKTLLVIVMLGCSNFVFNTLYKVQRIVVKEHIISNLLLPYQISSDTVDNFGAYLSEEMMYSFYQLENISVDEVSNEDADKIAACKNIVNAFRNQIIYQNRFDLGYSCLGEAAVVNITESEEQQVFIIDYNWLLAPIVGIFIVYMLLIYCFKIGVRMIQLMVLEVIAPMAIVSYVSPKKETMFDKWLKIYTSTYIDAFIRIAIINFIVFLIATILTSNPEEGFVFWESVGNPTDPYTRTFFKVVIVLALLTFAKKAPDLIKELLPASASKLGFGASMKDIVGLQKGAKIGAGILGGAAGGAAIGLIGGGLGGFAGGMFKGAFSGFKGQGFAKTAASAWKSQVATNKRIRDWRENGGGPSPLGRWAAGVAQSAGLWTEADFYDSQIGALKKQAEEEKAKTAKERRRSAAYSEVATSKKNIEDRAESKLLNGVFSDRNAQLRQQKLLEAKANIDKLKNSGTATETDIAEATQKYNKDLKDAKEWYISYSRSNMGFDKNMDNMFEDLKETISINADGAFDDPSFTGINTNFANFADLDAFEGASTTLNGKSKRTIMGSDAKIKKIEDQIDEIKASEGYIKAQNNKKNSGRSS